MRKSIAMLPLAALVVFAGCSNSGSVSGKVTLDDKPVAFGTVTFHPVEEGPAGVARIEEDGSYQIQIGTGRVLPPGEYIVTVEVSEIPPKEQIRTAKNVPMPPAAPKRLSPGRYASKDTSDLRCTVKSGSNTFDIDLKSK